MSAERARFWRLRLAAWRGDPDAMYDLACALELGVGARPNAGAATRWHRRAALRGEARSMAALGQRYASGQTLPGDPVAALAWLSLAVDYCTNDLLRRVYAWQRDDLAGRMSPADREAASRMAQEWPNARAQRGAPPMRRGA